MSGEEEPLSREELVECEFEAKLRENEQWPKRLEEICREAEIRWWSTHPWISSAGPRGAHGWCVTVPVRRGGIPD